MTIVVAIKCSDGAVIASDSMITVGASQQTGQKIHILPSAPQQLFAFAGDLGLAERFRAEATAVGAGIASAPHKLVYALQVGAAFVTNIQATGLDLATAGKQVAAVLAFTKDDTPEVCLFAGGSQPRFLDQHHYGCAIGSGDVAANPFLKFLSDTLLAGRQPNLAEGKLLAAWAVKYSIDTMAGGVGAPIDMATIERNAQGHWQLREFMQEDVEETRQAIQSGTLALRNWANTLGAPQIGEEVPEPPEQAATPLQLTGST